jgi:hypothetical protein
VDWYWGEQLVRRLLGADFKLKEGREEGREGGRKGGGRKGGREEERKRGRKSFELVFLNA